MGETLRIYPTRLKAEDELVKALSRAPSGAMFGGAIISFGQFEQMLTAELVGAQPVSEIRRWLMLHDAAAVTTHRPLAGDTEGFVRSVGEVVQQIKLGLVSADELERIEGFAPGKEEWLKKVFGRYARLLRGHGARDSADIMAELLARLAVAPSVPHCLARFDELHIHGVFHFTPSRFELIRLLGKKLPVLLHFPLPDDRRRVFDFADRDIRKFQSLEDDAGQLDLRFEEPPAEQGPLGMFCASLFGETAPAPIEGLAERLEIVKNTGRYREMEEAAQKILLMKGDRDWSDFCLVFRDLEKYGQIIEAVFRRAGIPLYLRRGVPVRGNPYVRALLGIFDAVETGYERDEIVKLAASDYFSFLPEGVEGHEAEKLLFKAGITAGPLSYWRERLGARSHGKKMKAVAAKVLKLVSALEKLEKASRAGACLSAFKTVIKLLGPRAIGSPAPYALRDAWCKSAFEGVLSELEAAIGELGMKDSRFGWRDLRRVLLNSLGNAHTPDWPNRNHVYALNVHELAGRTFKVVFICGLHDGEFPLRLERGSILSEAEKSAFNARHAETALAASPRLKAGRMVFSRLGESWEEESFIFYLAARAAETRLILTYGANDLAGKELMPSPFIEEILAMFPELREQATPAVAMEKDYASQLDTSARQAKLLADLFSRGAGEAGPLRTWFHRFAARAPFLITCDNSRIERERLRFYGEYDPDRRAHAASRWTGKLDGAASLPLAGWLQNVVRRKHSPTSLERYGDCPFRYFMDNVLECKPGELPTVETENTAEGEAAHAVMERYYKGRKLTPGALPPLAERLDALHRTARAAFREVEETLKVGEPGLWEISKRQIFSALELAVAAEDAFFGEEAFEVLETEFEFGKEPHPVSVTFGGETVHLKGKIDRVDLLSGPRLLRVIDYKYSSGVGAYKKKLKPESFCVASFQAPLYLFAALKHLGRNAAGGFAAYCLLKREPALLTAEGSYFDSAGGADALAALEGDERFGGRILAIVRRMESGEFCVTPTSCDFCRYSHVCRYIEVREVADEG